MADTNGFLAGRDLTLADLALAAHISALDYYGEIPWTDHPPLTDWYTRIKSRPSFRPLLADRIPGQPPVPHYAELDF
jgi:glutathione S-transferase